MPLAFRWSFMLDLTLLYLVALVSQATFALTLAILAWSDRRTRGTAWLAIACAMQFAWSASRSFSGYRVTTVSESLSAVLLVAVMYIVYVGVRWFACQRGLDSCRELAWVVAAMVVVAVAALLSRALAVQLGRCFALIIGIQAIAQLWTTPFKGMVVAARISAVLLGSILAIVALNFAATLPMESTVARGHETALMLALRGVTMALVTLLSFSFVGLFVGEANLRLHQDSRIDSLTQLRNRRAIEEVAVREVRVAQRTGRPLALLMMDLDYFKQLNDTWGHAFGDRALRAVGVALQDETGLRDVSARMGGEEFALLLPGRTLAEATTLAEKVRARIATMPLPPAGEICPMTMSIGVSTLYRDEPTWIEMLCRADAALYRAKRAGRNRVEQCDGHDARRDEIPQQAAFQPRNVRRWRNRILAPKQLL